MTGVPAARHAKVWGCLNALVLAVVPCQRDHELFIHCLEQTGNPLFQKNQSHLRRAALDGTSCGLTDVHNELQGSSLGRPLATTRTRVDLTARTLDTGAGRLLIITIAMAFMEVEPSTRIPVESQRCGSPTSGSMQFDMGSDRLAPPCIQDPLHFVGTVGTVYLAVVGQRGRRVKELERKDTPGRILTVP